MRNTLAYSFTSLGIRVEDTVQRIRRLFVEDFGEGRLVDIEVETYPNEYAVELVVRKKDEAVSEFISRLRGLLVDQGLSVLLLAREAENKSAPSIVR